MKNHWNKYWKGIEKLLKQLLKIYLKKNKHIKIILKNITNYCKRNLRIIEQIFKNYWKNIEKMLKTYWKILGKNKKVESCFEHIEKLLKNML